MVSFVTVMDQTKVQQSKLFIYNVLEAKDDLDERFERSFGILNQVTAGLSDRESNDRLNEHISKGSQQHDEIQHGCLYKILIDPKNAAKGYRDLTLLSRDSMTTILTRTNQLIHEKWIKLLDIPRAQILWLCRELVKNAAPGADSVCHSLLRQIAGGDVSQKNIWLTESMLDIFMEHRPWLDKFQQLLATAVYSYLRLIIDHQAAPYHALRQKEVEFCVAALRERWTDCMTIGRDLIRLLQAVARIPEIEKLWKDILHNPNTLSPTFTGIHQLMQMRTSRRLIASQLTPDMENKLGFLMSKVRFGQQKRYQDWFQRQYLSTPESQSLRCDLIRYICAVIHPSNEILSSDIIPRWAVIGWLLTTCTSNVAASNAKLALFYDWLFFGPEKDSIMNIEPCILVMYHSMRPHPAITATLLDFMCRIMTNFYPPLTPQIKMGMYTSLRTIQEKRVLASLSPLFDNPKLDKELRTMLRECFQEFCSPDVKEEATTNNHKDVMAMDMPEPTNHLDRSRDSRDDSLSEVAEFSDDEDDIPLDLVHRTVVEKLRNELNFRPIRELAKFEPVDTTEYLEQLEDEFRECVEEMQQETNNEDQCEIMDKLVQLVIKEDIEQDVAAPLAMCLCQILGSNFSKLLYPEDPNEDTIEDSIGSALFVIFRNLCQTPEEDPSRQPILLLLEEMYNKQPRVGYYFLYFLKVSKVHDEKMSAYKDFCNSMEARDIQSCLMNDLRLCQEDDVRLFTFLLPDIYTQFTNIAVGNAELLHIIVSSIDGIQLQDLICQILQGHLVMFRRDSFVNALNASLEWETIEQYFLWQLISVHNIPVESIMPILPKLEFVNHAEAITSIMVLLKQECPNMDMLRPIMTRECKKNDFFTVSILKYWSQEYEDDLASLLKNMLTKSHNTPNKKRNRQQTASSKSKEGPSVEQVLSHLEHLRQTCKNISFLTHETLQEGLRHIQMTGSEAQKTKFSELLALAEDFEEMRTTRVLRQVPSRRASQATALLKTTANSGGGSSSKPKKSAHPEDSDSADEFSDEEDVKPPKSKKRKKAAPTVDDDSD